MFSKKTIQSDVCNTPSWFFHVSVATHKTYCVIMLGRENKILVKEIKKDTIIFKAFIYLTNNTLIKLLYKM